MPDESTNINIDTGNATRSLKDLRNELKEAKNAMLSAKEGSDEYNAALKRATAAALDMKEMNEVVKGSTRYLGDILGQGTKVIGGVVGGMNALKGVTALMGTENKALEETFVKLQAGMAIVQGLQGVSGMLKGLSNLGNVMKSTEFGIKALTVAQKAWNFIMSINPIFLLITAIAAVGAGIFALTKILNNNSKEQAESNRLLEEYNTIMEETTRQADLRIKLMSAQGKSEKELNDQRAVSYTHLTLPTKRIV